MKITLNMYIKRSNTTQVNQELSLREMIKSFMEDNDIAESAIADEIKINRETFAKFLNGISELKFIHAIRFMKLLNLTESQLVAAYSKDFDENEIASSDKFERLSYITRNFDVVTLKKIGVIKCRAKIEEYEQQICEFFGFNSIYEYDDTSLMPTLFSKSRKAVLQEKEAKMTTFWLKCAISSFTKINNPHEYDKDLLVQLLKRVGEFTQDEINGYKKFVLVLFQLGITVLTQSYISGTKAFGVTMILHGKPCIVITDMNKKYHKLWISLLHELYHVINDFEMLEGMSYHLSNPETPEILLNESKADQFALNVLINPSIQRQLGKIVSFPFKIRQLAKELNVAPSIIYGVYLESLPNGRLKIQEFMKYNRDNILISSEIATRSILFDAISKRSLVQAIDKMKRELFRITI
ncbi:MAG: hypothetical protein SPF83_01275 [Butyricimonas virosa]|uniref:ImmA/IrrE family metallo-endopeptidase n=1 Tax=Butyricimonas virosa TaxID=544645 RepID=UPI002A917A07|nr:hypothetical protein [Butyricimonas virosa]MDY5532275.1 hypothetical protein [Butyricimonas virosa]